MQEYGPFIISVKPQQAINPSTFISKVQNRIQMCLKVLPTIKERTI